MSQSRVDDTGLQIPDSPKMRSKAIKDLLWRPLLEDFDARQEQAASDWIEQVSTAYQFGVVSSSQANVFLTGLLYKLLQAADFSEQQMGEVNEAIHDSYNGTSHHGLALVRMEGGYSYHYEQSENADIEKLARELIERSPGSMSITEIHRYRLLEHWQKQLRKDILWPAISVDELRQQGTPAGLIMLLRHLRNNLPAQAPAPTPGTMMLYASSVLRIRELTEQLLRIEAGRHTVAWESLAMTVNEGRVHPDAAQVLRELPWMSESAYSDLRYNLLQNENGEGASKAPGLTFDGLEKAFEVMTGSGGAVPFDFRVVRDGAKPEGLSYFASSSAAVSYTGVFDGIRREVEVLSEGFGVYVDLFKLNPEYQRIVGSFRKSIDRYRMNLPLVTHGNVESIYFGGSAASKEHANLWKNLTPDWSVLTGTPFSRNTNPKVDPANPDETKPARIVRPALKGITDKSHDTDIDGRAMDVSQSKQYSFLPLIRDFGLTGVQPGASLTNRETRDLTRYTYHAFEDLSKAINWNPQHMGLGLPLQDAEIQAIKEAEAQGRSSSLDRRYLPGDGLRIALAARGRGGNNAPMAHFEPLGNVINMAGRMGAGSLAHEFGHALDMHLFKLFRPDALDKKKLHLFKRVNGKQLADQASDLAYFPVFKMLAEGQRYLTSQQVRSEAYRSIKEQLRPDLEHDQQGMNLAAGLADLAVASFLKSRDRQAILSDVRHLCKDDLALFFLPGEIDEVLMSLLPSSDTEAIAEYIADNLKQSGLRPAGPSKQESVSIKAFSELLAEIGGLLDPCFFEGLSLERMQRLNECETLSDLLRPGHRKAGDRHEIYAASLLHQALWRIQSLHDELTEDLINPWHTEARAWSVLHPPAVENADDTHRMQALVRKALTGSRHNFMYVVNRLVGENGLLATLTGLHGPSPFSPEMGCGGWIPHPDVLRQTVKTIGIIRSFFSSVQQDNESLSDVIGRLFENQVIQAADQLSAAETGDKLDTAELRDKAYRLEAALMEECLKHPEHQDLPPALRDAQSSIAQWIMGSCICTEHAIRNAQAKHDRSVFYRHLDHLYQATGVSVAILKKMVDGFATLGITELVDLWREETGLKEFPTGFYGTLKKLSEHQDDIVRTEQRAERALQPLSLQKEMLEQWIQWVEEDALALRYQTEDDRVNTLMRLMPSTLRTASDRLRQPLFLAAPPDNDAGVIAEQFDRLFGGLQSSELLAEMRKIRNETLNSGISEARFSWHESFFQQVWRPMQTTSAALHQEDWQAMSAIGARSMLRNDAVHLGVSAVELTDFAKSSLSTIGITTDNNRDITLPEKASGKPYWPTHSEMFARAFEASVNYKLNVMGQANSFLVNGAAGTYYPSEQEIATISAALTRLTEAAAVLQPMMQKELLAERQACKPSVAIPDNNMTQDLPVYTRH
ncbi:MAG: hypothetical protein IBX50_04955, partial [Marinospirillum sp.]|uniref:LPD1 domain-containing protein n=1 Tax=Marinospirillum sp. TaxID=2183934 RepID=UPI001A09ADDB